MNRSKRGFTLVELMVSLAIFGIILGLAVPSVFNRMPDYRIERVSSSLAARLRAARMGAMASSSRAYIAFNQSEQTYSIWHDYNNDLLVDEGELDQYGIAAAVGATFAAPFAKQGFFNPGGFFETQNSSLSFLVFTVNHPGTDRRDILFIWPSGQVTITSQ